MGGSAFIGEVDDSTVFKYPLAPGRDMTRLEVERKLLEIILPHESIIAFKGFTDTGIYLERATNGTVAEYILESGNPLPLVKQRLACDLHVKLSDFQGQHSSEDGEVFLDGWSAESCRFPCPQGDLCDANVKTDLFALG
ncbi:hypothetical protein VTI74DRAFT_11199 [Chaetomium olivicolor]